MSGRALAAVWILIWAVQPMDDAAMRAIQSSRRPALEPVARALSDRSRVALGVVAAGALVAGGAARAAAIEAAVVLVPVNLAVEGLKRLTYRTRPDGEHKRSNAAFPSSHTANAFAVATVVVRRWKRSGLVAFVLAALVGWSRVYLNRHWPSDVVFGAMLGVGLALLTLAAISAWRASRDASATS